jgi:rubredoxin
VSVRVLCVRMSVHSALYTCQVVQQTGQQHSCKVLDWVYDTDHGDGDDEPEQLASTTGHQSWQTTGQGYWSTPLFSNTGE